MSTGKTHLKASLILAAGFSIGALISRDVTLLQCVAGSLVGVLVTPDLDVDAKNISSTIIKRKAGNFVVALWDMFWYQYRKSFKHGSFGSHFPVYSTFVRLAYIYFWVIFVPHFLIWLLFDVYWSLPYVLFWYAREVVSFYFFYGICSSDIIHYFLDTLTRNTK